MSAPGPAPTVPPALADAVGSRMDGVLRLVRRVTGLTFPTSRRAAVEAALWRAAHRARVDGPASLMVRASVDAATLDALLTEITVGETYFGREPGQFDFLRATALPALGARVHAGLRGWSAGCATGEEAYSLAATLRAVAPLAPHEVLGTDLSEARLRLARRGCYRAAALRGGPFAPLAPYLDVEGDSVVVRSALREQVAFRALNLAAAEWRPPTPEGRGFDVVLCRNVLIYLDRDGVRRVAERLLSALAPDGWLLLGASDPLLSDLVPCEVVITGAGLAYRRPRPPSARPASPPSPPSATAATASAVPAAPPHAASAATPPRPRARRLAPVVAQPTARAAYEAGDYPTAAARAALQDDADGAVLRVRALANLGQETVAAGAVAAALRRFPGCAELHYLDALLQAAAGRHGAAVDAGRRATRLDAGLVVAHLALAAALQRSGDVRAAAAALDTACALLAALPPGATVPAADGEPAGRLLATAATQRRLLGGAE